MIIAAILDAWAIVMPVDCAGCGAPDRGVCASCRSRLAPRVTQHRVGTILVLSALRYDDEARRAILAFKEHGRTDVARVLAGALAESVSAAASGADSIVAVPSSRAAYARRGYDPVRVLLRRAGLDGIRALEHARDSGTQKALDAGARASNRRGAFAATRRLDGRRVLIVDDVLTTGATISEAARALSAAGAHVAGAATLAFTPRSLPVRDNRSREDYGGGKGAE